MIGQTRSRNFFALCVVASVLCSPGLLRSQIGGTGSIQGTITDPSGAVIPGATVVATNVATGVKTTRQSSGAGVYVVSPLPPGEYTVSVSVTGFQTLVQQKIVVDALSTVGLNFTLQLGAANESVTVSEVPPQLNTTDARLGTTMRNDTYTALPLAVGPSGIGAGPRNPGGFIYLLPGVQEGNRWGYVNGAQGFSKDVYVEGLPITDAIQQGEGRYINLGVSVEAVEQFQVETSGQSVEFTGQGSENYVIKSGTNQYHGSVYEYFRNTALNARSFFANQRGVEHQNEFGFTFGGPVKKNRIFFFGTYTGWRYKVEQTARFVSLPTLKMRNGDFSELPVTIYDPATTNCSSGPCTRQAFPGNIIPANRISAISKYLQGPLPNTTNSNIQGNYLGALPIGQVNDNATVKVDINLTDAHRFSALFTRGRRGPSTPFREDPNPLPLPYTNTRSVEEIPTVVQLKHNWVISPNFLNQLNFGFSRMNIPITNVTVDGQWLEKAGLKGLPQGEASLSFPRVQFAGPNAPTEWRGDAYAAFTDVDNNFTLQDSAQWLRGKHAVKFGFQHQRLGDNYKARNDGTLFQTAFSNVQTAGFNASGTLQTATGNAFASYLLGAVNSATLNDDWVVAIGARYRTYAWWAQDDFKIAPNLTVNLGLRYDLMLPYVEVADRMSFMNPDLPNPAASGRPGALMFAGDYAPAGISCNCRTPIKTYHGAWGPRLGVAYSLNNKTVIRAGYGIMYTRRGTVGGREGGRDGTGTLGFNAAPGFGPLPDGYSPIFLWENGVPAYQKAPFFDSTLNTGFTTTTGPGGTVTYGDPYGKPPRYQNWNFSIQRALTSTMTVTAAYVGSNGKSLQAGGAGNGRGIWSNQIDPKYLALGNLLTQQATPANIASAQAIMSDVRLPYSNFQGTIGQMLRPFPQYNSVGDPFGNVGQSNYNALQLSVVKTASQGLTLNANYTLSKALADTNGGRTAYSWQREKSLSNGDQTHVFNGLVVYELPFGKGRAIAPANRAVSAIVSGWRVSGITRLQSGIPLGTIAGACNAPLTGNCFTNYNSAFSGNVRINGDWGDGDIRNTATAPAYIDRTAFASPAAFTFGNTPPTGALGLRQPRMVNQDAGVRRDFQIRENLRLGFQCDAFNIFNHVRFGGINTSITNANFGKVTSQVNTPRVIQFALRIEF